jgi:hypothetical protein
VDANGDGELLVVLDLRPDTDLQVSAAATHAFVPPCFS